MSTKRTGELAQQVHSASQYAVRSLGLAAPKLSTATQSIACGLCGILIREGLDTFKHYQPSAEFGASDHLSPDRSDQICSDCAVATGAASGLTTRHSRAIFFKRNAYRMSSAEDIGWMLTKAEPPFVAIFNTRSSAHVVWQAPITKDRCAIGIMIGQQAGVIRQQRVIGAHAALGRLTPMANAELQAHYQWPVINLTLYEDATDICQMIPSHARVIRKSELADVQADMAAFEDLNLPERWALSALLLARPKRNMRIDDFKRPPKIS